VPYSASRPPLPAWPRSTSTNSSWRRPRCETPSSPWHSASRRTWLRCTGRTGQRPAPETCSVPSSLTSSSGCLPLRQRRRGPLGQRPPIQVRHHRRSWLACLRCQLPRHDLGRRAGGGDSRPPQRRAQELDAGRRYDRITQAGLDTRNTARIRAVFGVHETDLAAAQPSPRGLRIIATGHRRAA
jgi:hypothetical protein